MAATGTRVIRLTVDASMAERGLKRVERSLRGLDSAGKNLNSTLWRMQSILGALGVGFGVKSLLDMIDTMTAAENRMKTYAGSMENVIALEKELIEVSNRTYSSYESTSTIFNRLTMVTKGLGYSYGNLLDVTEALNATFILSGSTAREAGSAALQLSQGLSSASLQGEELRAVLESNRFLSEIIAEEFDTTVGELRKLATEGKLTSERIVKAIADNADELRDRMSNWVPTISQAMTVLTNDFSSLVKDMDRTSGVSRMLGSAIIFLADNLTSVLYPAFVTLTAIAIPALIAGLAALGKLIMKHPLVTAGVLIVNAFTWGFEQVTLRTGDFFDDLKTYAIYLYEVGRLWGLQLLAAFAEGLQKMELMARNFVPKLVNWMKDNLPDWLAGGPKMELSGMDDLMVQFPDLTAEIEATKAALDGMNKALFGSENSTAGSTDEAKSAFDRFLETLNVGADGAIKKVVEGGKELDSISEQLADDYDALTSSFDAFRKGVDETYKAEQDLLDAEFLISDAVQANIISYGEGVTLLEKYKESVKGATDEANPFADAWTEATKRIDEAFASAWEGAFDSFKDFGKSILSSFRTLLAEMAHLAITKPIVMSFMGGFSASGAASAAGTGASMLGGGSMMSSVMSGAGSLVTGLGSVFGGGFGGGMALTGNSLMSGSLFGGLQAGASIFSAGGGLMPLIGAAAPYLLPLVGLAAALGVFGGKGGDKSPDLQAIAGSFGADQIRTTKSGGTNIQSLNLESAFGDMGFRTKHDAFGSMEDAEAFADMLRGIADIENSIAEYVGPDVSDRIARVVGDMMGEGMIKLAEEGDEFEAGLEGFFTDRFNAIFGEIGGDMEAVFRTMTGHGADVSAAAAATLNLFNAIDMYGTAVEDAEEAIEQLGWTQHDLWSAQSDALQTLIADYDGTLDATVALTSGLDEFRLASIDALIAIDDIRNALRDSFASTRETILTTGMSDEEKFNFYKGQADALTADLANMIDPVRIQETSDKILDLLNQTWSIQSGGEGWDLLSQEERDAKQTEYLGYVDSLSDLAEARLTAAEELVTTGMEEMTTQISTKLSEVATEFQAAASTMQQAADTPQQVDVNVGVQVTGDNGYSGEVSWVDNH